MSAFRKEVMIGDCRLILGDCREVLPLLPKVDAVVTDPPYGVGIDYNGLVDDEQIILDVVLPAIEGCRLLSKRVVVTSGNKNAWLYPRPDDFGVWWNPAGTSTGKWGFQCVGTPILYYGKDPRTSRGASPSSPVSVGASAEQDGKPHPCPKPLSLMKWLLRKSSFEGETVLDPFMGSGTTLVACARMGRAGIGIEIDEGYFDIACERVRKAYAQPDMFVSPPEPKLQQAALFDGDAA